MHNEWKESGRKWSLSTRGIITEFARKDATQDGRYSSRTSNRALRDASVQHNRYANPLRNTGQLSDEWIGYKKLVFFSQWLKIAVYELTNLVYKYFYMCSISYATDVNAVF
jgi:hypothetical protein